MSTVADIVRDALSHLRVQDPRQPVKPEHARDAIRALNLMMRRWEASGIALGWSDVVEMTDMMPVPAEAEEAIGYNLAVRLQSRLRSQLDDEGKKAARDGLVVLRADVQANLFVRVCYDDLPAGEGQRYGNGDWREGYTS